MHEINEMNKRREEFRNLLRNTCDNENQFNTLVNYLLVSRIIKTRSFGALLNADREDVGLILDTLMSKGCIVESWNGYKITDLCKLLLDPIIQPSEEVTDITKYPLIDILNNNNQISLIPIKDLNKALIIIHDNNIVYLKTIVDCNIPKPLSRTLISILTLIGVLSTYYNAGYKKTAIGQISLKDYIDNINNNIQDDIHDPDLLTDEEVELAYQKRVNELNQNEEIEIEVESKLMTDEDVNNIITNIGKKR